MIALLHQIDPVARVIVTLLFNSIWQGALVVAAVWLITRSIERTNATTRYLAWCLTLGAILIVPLATTLPAAVRQAPVVVQTLQRFVPIEASQPAQKTAHTKNSAPVSQPAAAPQHAFAQWWPPVPARFTLTIPAIAALAIFFVWLAVAVVLAVKLGIAIARLERLKRDAMPLPLEYRDKMEAWSAATRGKRRVRLCISRDVDVPVAVGLFDSMILIPTTLLEQLSENEIDQISLHELAHLRRWDDWTNGLQRLMQALFFFNPAMAWISRQLNLEREVACDDWVLSQTGNARPYASCLTKLAEVTAWPNAAIAAPGAFITRKNISIRIERLLDSHRNARPGLSLVASCAVVAAVAAALVFSSYVTPVIAYDESIAPLQKVQAINPLDRVVPIAPQKVKKTVPAPHTQVAAPVKHVKPSATYQETVVKYVKDSAQYAKDSARYAKDSASYTKLVQVAPAPVVHPIPGVHSIEAVAPTARVAAASALAASARAIPVAPIARAAAASAASVAASSVDVQQIVREVVPEALREASEAMKEVDIESKGARTGGLHCGGCNIENANWSGRDLRNADLTGSNLHNTNLSGADLRGARLSGANMHAVDMQNADLRGANLTGANLDHVNLRGAKLDGARFSGANIDIHGLDPLQTRVILTTCTGCNMAGANLRGMDLSGVHMSGMNLEGADLRDTNLSKARMVGVNLAGAKLEGANLRGATLSGANLDRVDLRRVDLTDVDLTGSNISTAILK